MTPDEPIPPSKKPEEEKEEIMNNDTIQNLFNHMYREHGLTLLVSEMDDIARIFDNEKIQLADRAFVAGRSQTSWEQFKKENDL